MKNIKKQLEWVLYCFTIAVVVGVLFGGVMALAFMSWRPGLIVAQCITFGVFAVKLGEASEVDEFED